MKYVIAKGESYIILYILNAMNVIFCKKVIYGVILITL